MDNFTFIIASAKVGISTDMISNTSIRRDGQGKR